MEEPTVDLAVLLAVQVVILIGVFILYALPLLIIFAVLAKKAGKPAWTQFIPAYNTYIVGVIGKKPKLGLATAILFILSVIARVVGLSGIASLINLAWLIVGLLALNGFVKQYNAGIGRWLLFVFIPIIGVFFVAKTQYIGGATVAAGQPTNTPPTAPVIPTTASAAPTAPITSPTTPTAPIAPIAPIAPDPQATPPTSPQA